MGERLRLGLRSGVGCLSQRLEALCVGGFLWSSVSSSSLPLEGMDAQLVLEPPPAGTAVRPRREAWEGARPVSRGAARSSFAFA